MSNVVITADGLGKKYTLGATVSFDLLQERLVAGVKRLFNGGDHRKKAEEFWALKDVSFSIREGDVVGIIGRNGAGKSTLLKILSQITEPSAGEVRIRGRVASLLEVGTGFHKELTGRENIFLNGAILGMSRAEIRAKFDEIVQFAGVEKFIDTPVKRYSSGMTVRLAFAVAAHLEPEILLIDEVLAVGDAEFQKRCLTKMGDVATEGRTIFFVSHNLAAVESLCTRGILLQDGCIVADGGVHSVLDQYQGAGGIGSAVADLREHSGRTKTSVPLMHRASVSGPANDLSGTVRIHDDIDVSVEYSGAARAFSPVLGVVIKDHLGTPVFSIDNRIVPGFEFSSTTHGTISCKIPRLPLMPGRYSMDLYLGDRQRSLDAVIDALSLTVVEKDVFGTGRLPPPHMGSIICTAEWKVV